jgi:iron complex transport system substrate-binding protein
VNTMNQRKKIITVYLFAVSLIILSWHNISAAEGPGPQRVVSLAPSVTETLFALGFGDRVVGVTTYCDYPPEARRLPKIGGFTNPSVEAIVATRPDLVIGVNDSSHPVKTKELEGLGIKIALISVTSLDEILNSFKSVARMLGRPEAGDKLAQEINRQFEQVKKRVAPVPRRSTLLAVGLRPLVAVGGKNFIDELITLAGGDNIAGNAAQPWLNLPDEYVIAKAPQVIIQAGMGSERGTSAKYWSDLKSIPAVKEGRVYSYPSDKILRPGPRVGEGLEEIARLVHPECFVEFKPGLNRRSGCEGSRP